ncbi:hypothetical protein [Telluribacter sp. SYSU D00476]|uniref:hypothetical protein n=1 Tax=Telluribacter sp. SYSU D00476 TaxID=2811430 RepID=UPI001FF4AAAA|nr:hypothetical protein [Telluribacter sp. SYSU D00476]
MAKTILIPTDFTIESLNVVKGALRQLEEEEVNLILVYSAHLSDCITDLLFFSKKKYLDDLQNAKFKEACEILQNKYASQINAFNFDLFTGGTQGTFQNFLLGNKIDTIFIPKTYRLKSSDKWGFDLLPYCKKSGRQCVEISWKETRNVPEKDKVAELFMMSDPI